jgi:hypothetical protein
MRYVWMLMLLVLCLFSTAYADNTNVVFTTPETAWRMFDVHLRNSGTTAEECGKSTVPNTFVFDTEKKLPGEYKQKVTFNKEAKKYFGKNANGWFYRLLPATVSDHPDYVKGVPYVMAISRSDGTVTTVIYLGPTVN